MNRDELFAALAKMERGPGKRYPPELRHALIRWVDRERERGCTWGKAAEALGLSMSTLMRWCSKEQAVPVVVQQEDAVQSVSVVTPTGWRIEGLSLEQAATLLGARGC